MGFFLNRELSGTQDLVAFTDGLFPFYLGGDPARDDREHFEGSLDDVALFDRALRLEEIALAMAGQISGPSRTALENWRERFFDSIENSGNGADSYDADGDGENNLIESPTDQDPTASSLALAAISGPSGELQFRYTRSKAAIERGVTFLVEWSRDLTPPGRETSGVTEIVESENTEAEEVMASLPASPVRARFMRLRVIR